MRAIIDIELRDSKFFNVRRGWETPPTYQRWADFQFLLTFVNGDSEEYLLTYTPETRSFALRKNGARRPKDLKRLSDLRSEGKEPFKVTGPLADHLRGLLPPEKLARCSAMSLGASQ